MKHKILLFAILGLFVCACDDDNPGTPAGDGALDRAVPTNEAGNPLFDGSMPTNEAGQPLVDGSVPVNEAGQPLVDGSVPNTDATPTYDGRVVADGWNPTNQPACNGKVYACSNGIDDDNDGLVDARDPECIGPCDDDESSFETGIPGDNQDPCKQDCFFDGDSGGGQDGCAWDLKCDPLSPGSYTPKSCPYDENYTNCPESQTPTCLNTCLPLTPNGCDCFGCCEITTDEGPKNLFLGSGPGCTLENWQNCAECTPVADCLNTCGECELCLGKTIDMLPAHCFTPPVPDGGVPTTEAGVPLVDGSIPTTEAGVPLYDAGVPPPPPDGGIIFLPLCDDGSQGCIDNSFCPATYYCITGCCKKGIL